MATRAAEEYPHSDDDSDASYGPATMTQTEILAQMEARLRNLKTSKHPRENAFVCIIQASALHVAACGYVHWNPWFTWTLDSPLSRSASRR